MKFLKSGQKGFTLIELLVVIAILGTLAAVVVLNVTRFIGAGDTQANLTDMANIQTAVAAFMYESPTHAPPSTPITPAAPGTIASTLLSAPKCSYTVDQSTGAVNQTSCP